MSKTAIVVMARFDSRRLPGKALLDICGKPMLERVLERASRASASAPTILATTERDCDDGIATFATQKGYSVFRGNTDDLLVRLIDCCEAFELAQVARISGDSPFIDPALIARAILESERTSAEIVTNVYPRTYPYGISVEVLPKATLEKIQDLTNTPADREHVTRYIYENPDQFLIENIEASDPRLNGLPLAVDTSADLDLARAICGELGLGSCSASLATVTETCLEILRRRKAGN